MALNTPIHAISEFVRRVSRSKLGHWLQDLHWGSSASSTDAFILSEENKTK